MEAVFEKGFCNLQIYLSFFMLSINRPPHNYLWRKVSFFFMATFLLLKVYKFYHPMLVLNAFAAISEGLRLKMFRGACPRIALGGTRQRIPSQIPPRPPIVNLLCTSVSDNQSFPPRDLPLRVSFGPSPFCIAAPYKKKNNNKIKKKITGYGPE